MTIPNDLIRRGDALAIFEPATSAVRLRIVTDINAIPAAPDTPEVLALVEAAKELQSDMLERAECGMDVISGEQYRVVNAGNGAWVGFCAAIAAWEASRA
jgi:hypothetical protein